MANHLAIALQYAARGLYVFPCAPRSKIPVTVHGCLDASIDPEQVHRWWEQEPRANVAIATGSRCGVWVLDVDPDKGGEASISKIEKDHEPLPPTVEGITGGGGRHLFF